MTSDALDGQTHAPRSARTAPIAMPMRCDPAQTSACGLAQAAGLERAARFGVWRERTLPFPVEDATRLLPGDALLVLDFRDEDRRLLVAEGLDFLVQIDAYARCTTIFVAVCTPAEAERVVDSAASTVQPVPSDTVPITLWRWAGHHATTWRRDLEAPTWPEIRPNYPQREDIDALMAVRAVSGSGRLVLWTGPPGTGKTYAIRALARAWQDWCGTHLIVDPERFFGDAAYLIDVVADSRRGDSDDGEKARLIICEDADDFIRARRTTGIGLGRLLNVADGLLGQGLDSILLLTANTPIDRLDPALLRPGRLLANVEFGPFAPAAGRDWLGQPRAAIPAAGATLAELYERAGRIQRLGTVSAHEDERVGAYL